MSDQTAPQPEDKRALAILLGVVFINIAGFGVVIPLLPFYASSFGAPAWQVIVLFSAYSLGNFFAEPIWGKLSDRIGRRPVLMLTIFGNALTYVLLAFAPNLWVAMAIRFCGGILTGNISTIQGYLADVTPHEKRAGRMGFMAAAFSLGFVTGPVLGAFARVVVWWVRCGRRDSAAHRRPALLSAVTSASSGPLPIVARTPSPSSNTPQSCTTNPVVGV